MWLPNDAGPSPLRSRAKITAPVSLTLSKCVTFSYSPLWSLSRLFWFQTGHSSCCQPRAASPVMRACPDRTQAIPCTVRAVVC